MECKECKTEMHKLGHDVVWCPECGTAEVDVPEPYNWRVPKRIERLNTVLIGLDPIDA